MFVLARAGPSRVSLPVLSRAIHTSLAVLKRQTPEERRLREAKAAETNEEAVERAEFMRKNNIPSEFDRGGVGVVGVGTVEEVCAVPLVGSGRP